MLEVPFREDGSLDTAGFTNVVDNVLATGVGSVMFPGFASEFHKLDPAERRTLRGLLLQRTNQRHDVTAIVSVPDHATRQAVREASEATQAGADAIKVLPPHQLGPSRHAVVEHLRGVLQAVDPVPVVVQYAPVQTGTVLDVATLRQLAGAHANLAMVKVEAVPAGRFVAALAADEGPGRPLPSMVGHAGVQMIDALRRGAVGVQPGCSFTELYVEVWRRWRMADHEAAADLHMRMLPYLSYWMQDVELIIAAEKALSRRRGWFSSAYCRAPGYRLDAEELALIDRFCAGFPQLWA